MRVKYPKDFNGIAILKKSIVYFFHQDRILFFNQEKAFDPRILAILRLKSWKQPQ
jgi:hypothetical protein